MAVTEPNLELGCPESLSTKTSCLQKLKDSLLKPFYFFNFCYKIRILHCRKLKMQKTKNKKMKIYSSYSEITTLNILVYVSPDISLTKLCLKLQEFYSSLFNQKENMPGLGTNGNCIDRIESQL